MRRLAFLVIAVAPAVAVAAPIDAGPGPGDELEPLPATDEAPIITDDTMTEDELAAEEDAEIALSHIEDEAFGRPKKTYKHEHHRSPRPVRRFAIASTAFIGSSVGGSLYIAVGKTAAVRINAVAYKYQANPALGLAVALIAHEPYDEENYRKGSFVDAGASFVLFGRQVLDGPILEVGALVRRQDSYLNDWRDEVTTRESITVAGRAMVGWTWRIGQQYFVSMALGGSHGYARGTGGTADRHIDGMTPITPYRIAGWETKVECYTRIGFEFGGAR